MIIVQFSDSTQSTIVAYFGSPQDLTTHAHMGEVATSDARWHAYYSAMPPTVQSQLPTPT